MLKNCTPRVYQEAIFAACATKNCLVILPTGLGKTFCAMMLAAHRLALYPKSKILFLAPTKPLVEQHKETFIKHIDLEQELFGVLTGQIAPQKRAEQWRKKRLIFSTPQTIQNDLLEKRISFQDTSLVIFDEAHRAVGDYAYVFVAQRYHKESKYPRILALTASPGSNMTKIKEVIKNLYIEDIEIRTRYDPDVKPYIKDIDMSWISIELPPSLNEARKALKKMLYARLEKLNKFGIFKSRRLTKKALLELQAKLQRSDDKADFSWHALSLIAETIKIQHSIELLETQGIEVLHSYLTKIMSESSKTKAASRIANDALFKEAAQCIESMYMSGYKHPKMLELCRIIKNEIASKPLAKIIVFNQYRENAKEIVKTINSIKGAEAKIFVGQLKKLGTGLSQQEQKKVIEQFKAGLFNVLVATSVGEEGLDIPSVDTVIFYEPIPSAIRHIQRRGRTGRHDRGKVFILVAKGTLDESYRWSAFHKERLMQRNILKLKKQLYLLKQKKLQSFSKKSTTNHSKIKIYVDFHEKSSPITQQLQNLGAEIHSAKLCTDYILSSRVGVEVKTVSDFARSLIDKRLFEQAESIRKNFERPLIVIQGECDLYDLNIHKHAILGALAALLLNGITIIKTKDARETAMLLFTLAKREQQESSTSFSFHDKKPKSLKKQQEYLISSFPGIGPVLARSILKHFKSIRQFIIASEQELLKVDGIGKKLAKRIKALINAQYAD